jgi:Na+-driven multidrug efflux pump
VAAGGIAGLPAVFRLMEAEGEVASLARDFLVVQLLGAFLIYGYFVVAAAFRSAGDTRTPFLLLGASVLVNLVLDPLMILGWGRFQRSVSTARRWPPCSPAVSASSWVSSCSAGEVACA